MGIFDNNKKRVYLRRKSLRLQGFARASLLGMMIAMAGYELTKEQTDRGGMQANDIANKIHEVIGYSFWSKKYEIANIE